MQRVPSARLKKAFRAAKELATFTYPRLAKIGLFTHPIFESDFDCLTGKNRLHALSLLSPLASHKPKKNLQKKCILFNAFLFHLSVITLTGGESQRAAIFRSKL